MLENDPNQDINNPEFIKRINVILGIAKSEPSLEVSQPIEPINPKVNEWVSEGQKELFSAKKTFLLSTTGASATNIPSQPIFHTPVSPSSTRRPIHPSLSTLPATQPEPVYYAPEPAYLSSFPDAEIPPRKGFKTVRVCFGGLEFSGKLVSEEGGFVKVEFPDGKISQFTSSQVIK